MPFDFADFINAITANPVFLLTTTLIIIVILLYGRTAAPNAITTAVSTKSISPRRAIVLSVVFNFIGALVITLINAKVAATMFNLAGFGGDASLAMTALAAALLGIVLWSGFAWYYGIPTSLSHALIAGISGAAIALSGNFAGINGEQWLKVLYGLGLSTFLGFGAGWFGVKLTEYAFRKTNRHRSHVFFRKGQVFAAAASSFMYGAQDGQKFIGVFMLSVVLTGGGLYETGLSVPLSLIFISSIIIALGTITGGSRVIKTVGMNMVRLDVHEGFASDIATASCLLFSSLLGIPVSTAQMKTTAVMGAGAAKRLSAVKWRVVRDMVLAWLLTFPVCGIAGYGLAKLFIMIF